MLERSPWEGTQDGLNGFTALGRVTSVVKETRRCRVKTLGKKGITDDLDLQNVQWLNLASHGEGDEDTFIPRIGAYGVVIFINSEPYILGWFQPMNPTGTTDRPDKEPLLPGDRIIKTIAGNKVILRSGGSVEIESTGICRTYWLPSRNLITSVCQEYELEADGGYMYWHKEKGTSNTVLQFHVYNNLQPTKAVDLQIGSTASGALLDLQMGDAGGAPNFHLSVQPNGDTHIDVGPGKYVADIQASSGNLTETIAGNVTQTVAGNAAITVAGKTDIVSTGQTTVKGSNVLLNSGSSPVLTEETDSVVDLITLVPTKGVTTVKAGS